jgi:hypothetical protein
MGSFGRCHLLFSALLVLNLIHPVFVEVTPAQLIIRETETFKNREYAPRAELLTGPTEFDNLVRWLEDIYPVPQSCTDKKCQGILQIDHWVGHIAETDEPCTVKLQYAHGGEYLPGLDILLKIPHLHQNEPFGASFRTSISFDNRAELYFRGLSSDKWAPMLKELRSEVHVTPEYVIIQSRPMFPDMLIEDFLESPRHSIEIHFASNRKLSHVIGREPQTRYSVVCMFEQ